MTVARVRLALALLAFFGWLGYLGYAAATKSRGPIVSHARAAAAKTAVVADLTAGPDGKLPSHVKGTLADKHNENFDGEVVNLPDAQGYTGPGKYLLLLEPLADVYRLVLPPRSPGYEHPSADKPLVYPWTTDVQAQMAKLTK
jgi:hypothetical protein